MALEITFDFLNALLNLTGIIFSVETEYKRHKASPKWPTMFIKQT